MVPIARGRLGAAIGTVSTPPQIVIIDFLLRQKSDRLRTNFAGILTYENAQSVSYGTSLGQDRR